MPITKEEMALSILNIFNMNLDNEKLDDDSFRSFISNTVRGYFKQYPEAEVKKGKEE